MATAGTYLLGEHLGDCGVSQVFLARPAADPHGIPVTIKRVLPAAAQNQQVQEMARQEAQLLMTLHHPGVVRTDALLEENGPLTVMQHHPAVDVRAGLKQCGTLSPSMALHVATATARALHHAHQAVASQSEPFVVTHRTLGPGDVWLCLDGQVRLVDFFGTQPELAPLSHLPGVTMGTRMEWLSPEQVRGFPTVDSRTDVWAVGTLLFLMLTGVAPFRWGFRF